MKRPFITKPVAAYNPDGVYGVGNQPINTMLVGTDVINDVVTVVSLKITDGVTAYKDLKELLSEAVDLSDYLKKTGDESVQVDQYALVGSMGGEGAALLPSGIILRNNGSNIGTIGSSGINVQTISGDFSHNAASVGFTTRDSENPAFIKDTFSVTSKILKLINNDGVDEKSMYLTLDNGLEFRKNSQIASLVPNPSVDTDVTYTLPVASGVLALQSDVDSELSNKADLIGGLIPASQLPSYVDDVLEFANLEAFPSTGESGKIYIAVDTNKTYRWSGSSYAIISDTIALGETSSTAYRGDRGKTAYDHSQATGNPHNTTIGDIGGLTSNLNSRALDTDVLHKTGDEIKNGNLNIRGLFQTGDEFSGSGYVNIFDGQISAEQVTYRSGDYQTIFGSTTSLTANRAITLPDKNGMVALTSDIPSLTSYALDANVIHKTGSETKTGVLTLENTSTASDLILTNKGVTNGSAADSPILEFRGKSSSGTVGEINRFRTQLKTQSLTTSFSVNGGTTYTNGFSINVGSITLYKTSGAAATISTIPLSVNRSYQLPDADGTFALTSDFGAGKTILAKATGTTLQDVLTAGNNTTSSIQINNNVPLLFGNASNVPQWGVRNSSDGLNRLIFSSASSDNLVNILQDGSVGIGANPIGKLTVSEATGVTASVPSAGSGGGTFQVLADGSKYGIMMGVLNTGSSFIQNQRTDGSTATYNLLLNPNGGDIGIGTTTTSSKVTVGVGDVEVANIGNGFIVKSPNGTRWRITVSDAGVLTTTSL